MRSSFFRGRVRALTAVAASAASTLALAAPASVAYPGQNGRVAYNNGGDIWVTNPERTLQTKIKDGGMSSASPTFSKNGRVLAFAAEGSLARSQIFVVTLPKTGLLGKKLKAKQPTKNAIAKKLLAARNPALSPNGKTLAFVCERNSGNFDICTIGVDGKHLKYLTNCNCASPGRNSRPDWSSQGNRIVFGDATKIYTINSNGSNRKLILDPAQSGGMFGSYWYPSWSPDGTKLLFSGDGSDNSDILVANADGSGRQVVFRPYDDGQGDLVFPSYAIWAPDGTRYLEFIEGFHTANQLVTGPYANGVFGGPDQKLTSVGSAEFNPQPAWAPVAH
jgi:Tol biopolymer transport system component